MPLVSLESVLVLLRCPRCGAALERRPDGLGCTDRKCALAARAFADIGGQPALVDFERSVVTERELRARAGASAVRRVTPRGARGALRRIASHRNRVAERHAHELVERLASAGGPPARLLIVGGGTRGAGTRVIYESPALEVLGFDIYASAETRFIADAHQIPLAAGCVQAVWIQAVLEHVLEPQRVVAEIERVLSPGGLVYAETPFLQHVHEGPWDFSRFTESGHRWLFRGFERIDSGVVAGPAEVWLWATEMLARGLTRSHVAGVIARLAWSWVRVLDRLIPRAFAVDGASCVFFFGRKGADRLAPAGAIHHYLGEQRPTTQANGEDAGRKAP